MYALKHMAEGKPKHLSDTHLGRSLRGLKTPDTVGCSLKTNKVGHVNFEFNPVSNESLILAQNERWRRA